jgi:hypothetical protein
MKARILANTNFVYENRESRCSTELPTFFKRKEIVLTDICQNNIR